MKTSTLRLLLAVITFAAPAMAADDKSSDAKVDQTENDYYWKGTQLYNLGRLGEAFESFEKAIQRKQNAKESEAYLMQIRTEIVNNAKSRAKERETVNTGSANPDSALNIVYVEKGHIRVFMQAKFLFDENASTLKTGAIDVINKAADILQNKEGNRIEFTLINEMDPIPHARDIDAERALAVFALINFKRLASVTPS
jgi:outer membrane protein OmpA-like peptidoglycan-associated protein